MPDNTIKFENINADTTSASVSLSGETLQVNCAASPATPFTIYEFTTLPMPQPPPVLNELYQKNPRKSSSDPKWRSCTHSLESYENAVKKEYQLLQRNFEYTQEYPDFHVSINFHNAMRIEDFSKIRGKAFGRLVQAGIKAYYVHEPSRSGWLHIHAMVIFSGKKEALKDIVKKAFVKAGLEYETDFHCNIIPFKGTDDDFRRLCSYILKFTGARNTPHSPVLFTRGLRIRKVGMIGKWFFKPKNVLWKEYIDEMLRKHS